jgi:hypothetical protein
MRDQINGPRIKLWPLSQVWNREPHGSQAAAKPVESMDVSLLKGSIAQRHQGRSTIENEKKGAAVAAVKQISLAIGETRHPVQEGHRASKKQA